MWLVPKNLPGSDWLRNERKMVALTERGKAKVKRGNSTEPQGLNPNIQPERRLNWGCEENVMSRREKSAWRGFFSLYPWTITKKIMARNKQRKEWQWKSTNPGGLLPTSSLHDSTLGPATTGSCYGMMACMELWLKQNIFISRNRLRQDLMCFPECICHDIYPSHLSPGWTGTAPPASHTFTPHKGLIESIIKGLEVGKGKPAITHQHEGAFAYIKHQTIRVGKNKMIESKRVSLRKEPKQRSKVYI